MIVLINDAYVFLTGNCRFKYPAGKVLRCKNSSCSRTYRSLFVFIVYYITRQNKQTN